MWFLYIADALRFLKSSMFLLTFYKVFRKVFENYKYFSNVLSLCVIYFVLAQNDLPNI